MDAIELGYRHIDTAAVYENEVGVGQGIAASGVAREELFVTSKLWNTERGYEKTKAAFQATLDRLKLDYLDLYLIHWPANEKQFGQDAEKLNAETWWAMEDLYNEGRIRAIGVSNFLPHHIKALMKTAKIKPTAQVALRWELQQGVLPLPKSVHRERSAQNMDIFDFELSESEMQMIQALPNLGGQCAKPDEVDF